MRQQLSLASRRAGHGPIPIGPSALCLLVGIGVLSFGSCASPTAPEGGAPAIVTLGPHVLWILPHSTCVDPGQGVFPEIRTRVTVSKTSIGWQAESSTLAAGNILMRLQQAGPVIVGAMPIAGTIEGTAIHMPELFPGPAWEVRGTFGGSASLSGTAFAAGFLGAPTSGMNGLGNGSLTLTSAVGGTCTETTFSWSMGPQQ